MLVGDPNPHTIDLLAGPAPAKDPLTAAGVIAQQRFREQLAKAGLAAEHIREAWLELQRSPRTARVFQNGLAATGFELTLTARVISDLGTTYESKQSIFAAPHDPAIELQSTRSPS